MVFYIINCQYVVHIQLFVYRWSWRSMTSSLRRVHLLQSISPSDQQIQMPRECPGTQVKCNIGVKQNREGKTRKYTGQWKKVALFPFYTHSNRNQTGYGYLVDFFGFVFLTVRVRNLNWVFSCPETKFFPLQEVSQKVSFSWLRQKSDCLWYWA